MRPAMPLVHRQPPGLPSWKAPLTPPASFWVPAPGGLTMHQGSYHRPVMANEVMELLGDVERGIVIDATYGGGGHAALLVGAGHSVVAFDRDPNVPTPGGDITLVHRPFGEIPEALDELGIDAVSGALFDLGVSSHQFDTPERGFSYRNPGPIDMRMDPDQALSASTIVNEWGADRIAAVLKTLGEERFARRIADAIVAARPISDTATLAGVVTAAIPAATRRTGGHPARRTFQALRMAVNSELEQLEVGLDGALRRLGIGGRCVVISYHSLEDRIVKRRFAEEAQGCVCPPEFPVCRCDREPSARILTRKALRPTPDEIEENPRARSARLRALERIVA